MTPSTHNLIPTSPFGGHNGFGSQRDVPFRGHNNQRTGYSNYSASQRGQYKHNQNSSNLQFNRKLIEHIYLFNVMHQNILESNKDVAPRFKKNNLIVAKDEIADVELRPNSMLFNKASSVKANNVMNNRVVEPSFTPTSIKQPPSTLLKEPLPIKQVPADKPKQSKKDKVSINVIKTSSILLVSRG